MLDQSEAPLLDALAMALAGKVVGFGAPGHHGTALPTGTRKLLGTQVFAADVLTPKGLEDRTESRHALQRAHEIAAEAWGAQICRFATGGSTQSLHTLLAAIVPPGGTVVIAQNAHKAEFSSVLFSGLHPVVVPVAIDTDWDLEHGVAPAALVQVLAATPEAQAVIIVSPTYYGVTSDIAALAEVCHARRIPLVVDAAWGGAFGFSPRLPANPLSQGADAMVASLHKTMGGLGQGSVMLGRGGLIDLERLALAYELFQTTSPSIPILASMDATRRDHALQGAHMWGGLLDEAEKVRRHIAKIDGMRVLGRDRISVDGAYDLDETKILIDVARLGVTGFAADDWLVAEHGVSVALSDARHLLVIVGPGTTARSLRRLERGLRALVATLRRAPDTLPAAPPVIPRIGALSFELAMSPSEAFFALAEKVAYEAAAGRICAEVIAPAPPGIPRLIPGQRISPAHAAWLTSNRDAGMFVLDPADPSERMIRVVAEDG
jgi:arginine/lysine/ornithine decarboxylase